MYKVVKIQVKNKDSELYKYCERFTRAANNLYNAAMFRVRQVATAMEKKPKDLTANEKEVLAEIEHMFLTSDKAQKLHRPQRGKCFLSYGFLECLLRSNNNPDFFAPDISKQTAQQTLKEVCRAESSFYHACSAYKKCPESFTGTPKFPKYKKKGGMSTVTLTNQDCKIKGAKKDAAQLSEKEKQGIVRCKFPLTKATCELRISPEDKIREVKIIPTHDIFVIAFCLDDGKNAVAPTENPKNICAIDFGISNLAAITNNVGAPRLLFKGGVIKSANQWYNKQMAKIQSQQTVGTTQKFESTSESKKLCRKRENITNDAMHKAGKAIINYCLQYKIDTIVMGKNNGWKQSINMGSKNNQKFVQIPFAKLIGIITYLAEREGIKVILQEESYTSKASFLDNDPIPAYKKGDDTEYHFSGQRAPKQYHGLRSKSGFRGLYVTKNGIVVNSDFNGSANIGRKAFPELFNCDTVSIQGPVIVIKYPGAGKSKPKEPVTGMISKAKQRRLTKKRLTSASPQHKNVTLTQGRACV